MTHKFSGNNNHFSWEEMRKNPGVYFHSYNGKVNDECLFISLKDGNVVYVSKNGGLCLAEKDIWDKIKFHLSTESITFEN